MGGFKLSQQIDHAEASGTSSCNSGMYRGIKQGERVDYC